MIHLGINIFFPKWICGRMYASYALFPYRKNQLIHYTDLNFIKGIMQFKSSVMQQKRHDNQEGSSLKIGI